jgi:hypothetical protein
MKQGFDIPKIELVNPDISVCIMNTTNQPDADFDSNMQKLALFILETPTMH